MGEQWWMWCKGNENKFELQQKKPSLLMKHANAKDKNTMAYTDGWKDTAA